jgi:DNA-binding CsgD family transcriptional regulator
MMLKSTRPDTGRGPVIEAIATARRRRAPRFAIVNEAAHVVLTSSEPAENGAAEMPFSTVLTAQLIAEIEAGKENEVFALISPTTVVRATPLNGNGTSGKFYALFVEHVESRDLLSNASESYGLSSRELDVLRLVLHGMNTAEIAHRLCIAATTVNAHVKNIARKTKSTKRTEILAKLLGVR